MHHNVLVTFRGLCVFVPKLDGQPRPQRITVVLVNARSTSRASNGILLPAHTPLVLFERKYLDGELPRHVFVLQYQGVEHCAWFLEYHELKISAAQGLGFRIQREARRPDGGGGFVKQPDPRVDPLEENQFYWVSDSQQIQGAGVRVNPGALNATPDIGLVAARMDVANGIVRVGSCGRNPNGGFTEFSFTRLGSTTPGTNYRQSLAEDVEVELFRNAGSVLLERSRFGGGTGDVERVRLKSDGGPIRIEVWNSPMEAILGTAGSAHHAWVSHFELFYKVLTGFNEMLVPYVNPHDSDPPLNRSISCPPLEAQA